MGNNSTIQGKPSSSRIHNASVHIGMENRANTCYMNSILQSLYSLRTFRNELISFKDISDKNSILYAMQTLFSIISSKTQNDTLRMDDFINVIKRNNADFNNDRHHDAHEFLTWLLDTMETNIKNEKRENNLISNTFRGIQISQTKCLNCEKCAQMEEPYYYLSVDVEQNTSLPFCLKQYIKKELMSSKDKFYCEKCNSLQEAERQVQLDNIPQVMIIQLKRFKMYGANQILKLNSLINLPLDINFDFLVGYKKNYGLYILRAIVIHAGSRGDFGHYFTFVRDSNEGWILYNDEKCETYTGNIEDFFGNPDESYQFNNSNCAYLLFYEKK